MFKVEMGAEIDGAHRRCGADNAQIRTSSSSTVQIQCTRTGSAGAISSHLRKCTTVHEMPRCAWFKSRDCTLVPSRAAHADSRQIQQANRHACMGGHRPKSATRNELGQVNPIVGFETALKCDSAMHFCGMLL
eukprot:6210423-Pleurochrysis_carterae.AAC.3